MNYPAVSRGISSSVLARRSVLDAPAPYWIRGNPVGPFWIPAPAPDSDLGSAGMTNSWQAAGNELPVDSIVTHCVAQTMDTTGLMNSSLTEIFSNAADGVLGVDQDHMITLWNEA